MTSGDGDVLTSGDGDVLTSGDGDVLTSGDGDILTWGRFDRILQGFKLIDFSSSKVFSHATLFLIRIIGNYSSLKTLKMHIMKTLIFTI